MTLCANPNCSCFRCCSMYSRRIGSTPRSINLVTFSAEIEVSSISAWYQYSFALTVGGDLSVRQRHEESQPESLVQVVLDDIHNEIISLVVQWILFHRGCVVWLELMWHVSNYLRNDVTVSNIAIIWDSDISLPSIGCVLYASSPSRISFTCSSLMLWPLPCRHMKYNTFDAFLNISGLSWWMHKTVANRLLSNSYWLSSNVCSDFAVVNVKVRTK